MTYGVLILGSTMPWEEYYARPGQARGVQIDLKPDRDRAFLAEAQLRMAEWNRLLDQVETTARSPLRPQMLIRVVTDLLADNAIISLDCGANTHFAARCLRLRADQRFNGTGMLASMAPGLPYAIAAKLAYPDRQSVAIVGDRGFAMLMAELTTALPMSCCSNFTSARLLFFSKMIFTGRLFRNMAARWGPSISWLSPKHAGATGSVAIGPTMSARPSKPLLPRQVLRCSKRLSMLRRTNQA
jgi:hypothetical protein